MNGHGLRLWLSITAAAGTVTCLLAGCGSSTSSNALAGSVPAGSSSTFAAQAASISTSQSGNAPPRPAAGDPCVGVTAVQASDVLGGTATKFSGRECGFATGSQSILSIVASKATGGDVQRNLQAAVSVYGNGTPVSGIGDGAVEVTDALGSKGSVALVFIKGGTEVIFNAIAGAAPIDASKLEALARTVAAGL